MLYWLPPSVAFTDKSIKFVSTLRYIAILTTHLYIGLVTPLILISGTSTLLNKY